MTEIRRRDGSKVAWEGSCVQNDSKTPWKLCAESRFYFIRELRERRFPTRKNEEVGCPDLGQPQRSAPPSVQWPSLALSSPSW